MSDTKILQAILDGQKALEERLSNKIEKVDRGMQEININLQTTEKNLTGRIDELGLQIADLEDDAPTIEEFENLENRVTKIESKLQIQTQ